MPSRIRVGVIFGGRSGEHEVSLRSAESVINALDRNKYDVVPIAITKAGKWLASSKASNLLPGSVIEVADHRVAIFGDPTERGLAHFRQSGDGEDRETLDVVIPVLHGTYGEDGTIQGLLEMADIPYVGCGVLGSAAGMDKAIMKSLFRDAGIPVCRWIVLRPGEPAAERVAAELGFPCFVKPANLGSSVGISKVRDAG